MRQLALALLFTAPFVAAAGCNKNAANHNAAPLPHYTVAAGPVTGNRASGIDASFRITQASAPDANPASGIPSDLMGGACIVFRAQDLGYTRMTAKSCNSADDCDTGEGAPYCQTETHQCWSRPIKPLGQDPLCNRSVDYTPPTKKWPVGTDVPVSKDQNPIPVASYHLQPNAQAVAIACLRGKGAKSGCGDKNSIVKWGQPTTIP